MRNIIILLAALVALVGASTADVFTGNGQYTWNGAGCIMGDGSQAWSSGLSLNMGSISAPLAAQSTVNNQMQLTINQNPDSLYAPITATQSGGNTITVNNGQEPGTTDPQIMDFASTSCSGGSVLVASEGMGNGVLDPVTGLDTAATFQGHSVGTESSTDFLLNHNVMVTDTNNVAGAVYIDPISVGTDNEETTVDTGLQFNHVPVIITVPDEDALAVPDAHVKVASFNWNCVDAANLKYEDCYLKDDTFTSGICTGAYALAEVSPLANGLSGSTSGITVVEGGNQRINVQQENFT